MHDSRRSQHVSAGQVGAEFDERQDGVHAARSKSVQIKDHVFESQGMQAFGDLLADFRTDKPEELIAGNFDASQIVRFVAHTEFPQSECLAQKPFREIDARDPLGGDFQSIGDPAGKAGGGRFVPDGKIPFASQSTDVCFRQSNFDERTTDPMLPRRFHSRTIVAAVIKICSIDENAHVERRCDGFELRIQFRLAEKAAIRRISEIIGVLEFVRVDRLMPNTDLASKLACLVQFTRGEA